MPSENFDRRGRAQTKQRDRSIRDRNCFIFRVQSIRVASPPPWFEWLATKKTMRIEKRWFHVTIVRERSNDYPLFHIVRNRRTLDWLHFDEKSASHATDLNYDCHTSCVSPVMMKGRINSIRCVLRVTNRGRNTLLSFAYFMAEAWRKIRVKLRENLYEVFIRRRFDNVQLCSSLS